MHRSSEQGTVTVTVFKNLASLMDSWQAGHPHEAAAAGNLALTKHDLHGLPHVPLPACMCLTVPLP
jgi:hypothetical protein